MYTYVERKRETEIERMREQIYTQNLYTYYMTKAELLKTGKRQKKTYKTIGGLHASHKIQKS